MKTWLQNELIMIFSRASFQIKKSSLLRVGKSYFRNPQTRHFIILYRSSLKITFFFKKKSSKRNFVFCCFGRPMRAHHGPPATWDSSWMGQAQAQAQPFSTTSTCGFLVGPSVNIAHARPTASPELDHARQMTTFSPKKINK